MLRTPLITISLLLLTNTADAECPRMPTLEWVISAKKSLGSELDLQGADIAISDYDKLLKHAAAGRVELSPSQLSECNDERRKFVDYRRTISTAGIGKNSSSNTAADEFKIGDSVYFKISGGGGLPWVNATVEQIAGKRVKVMVNPQGECWRAHDKNLYCRPGSNAVNRPGTLQWLNDSHLTKDSSLISVKD